MVKLEEVPDEEFNASQQGPKEEEDDWESDSGKSHLANQALFARAIPNT